MKIISDCLNEEMNEQNTFADLVGCSYEFHLPTISNDDWINSINDISIMSFIQGIPVGNTEGLYYNSYALGGSQIVRRDLIYGATYDSGVNLYHTKNCPVLLGNDGVLTDDDYDLMFITEDDAYANGYISCQKCH